MTSSVAKKAKAIFIEKFLLEDDLLRNQSYMGKLPKDLVQCSLKIKSDLVLSGLEYFFETFNTLSNGTLNYDELLIDEGKDLNTGHDINFTLPFDVALTGERVALNLLQHASSISTYTKKFVDKASKYNIEILDTRKTTPGLRALEKYAVQAGGGKNHRLGQADMWMIKDNHKSFFGGVDKAIEYFKSVNSFYTPILLEVHDLSEIEYAKKNKIQHLMLDNFTPEMVKEAIPMKADFMTYEVSGGIRLETMDDYLIEGVDAFSIGAITYDAPHVDISLKYKRA